MKWDICFSVCLKTMKKHFLNIQRFLPMFLLFLLSYNHCNIPIGRAARLMVLVSGADLRCLVRSSLDREALHFPHKTKHPLVIQ